MSSRIYRKEKPEIKWKLASPQYWGGNSYFLRKPPVWYITICNTRPLQPDTANMPSKTEQLYLHNICPNHSQDPVVTNNQSIEWRKFKVILDWGIKNWGSLSYYKFYPKTENSFKPSGTWEGKKKGTISSCIPPQSGTTHQKHFFFFLVNNVQCSIEQHPSLWHSNLDGKTSGDMKYWPTTVCDMNNKCPNTLFWTKASICATGSRSVAASQVFPCWQTGATQSSCILSATGVPQGPLYSPPWARRVRCESICLFPTLGRQQNSGAF